MISVFFGNLLKNIPINIHIKNNNVIIIILKYKIQII